MKYLSKNTIKQFKTIFYDDIINIILDYHKQIREHMRREETREKLYKGGCITIEDFENFMSIIYNCNDFSDSYLDLPCCEECYNFAVKDFEPMYSDSD